MSDSEGVEEFALDSVFTEPPRPPTPEPTTAIYKRNQDIPGDETTKNQTWSSIEIRLVGSHPLWGHYLWNASRAFASYLDERPQLYHDRTVLELGAGGGLPGIVTAKNDAGMVALTDYPDAALLENLAHNVQTNVPPESLPRVHVKGYIWGHPVAPLMEMLPETEASRGFDLIIMSDLVFNHSQHNALLKTCEQVLRPSPPEKSKSEDNVSVGDAKKPCLLVFYTHHRPHLAHRDMEFFSKAQERGWICEEVLTQTFPPMFPDDPGAEEVRATVHGWRLTRS
ncbi:hypothetical protein IEO21_01970 [Rhodonia placenta]|uniref:Protein N-terminal and lysine N-methyltransferase EFM7 n=1 Tax=Rhodonia placenta TaxID=104341 RepID=A0A8H7P8Z1_9APHY|nr:hypothetical protein IEO21_01970 [Postia placenta]